MERIAIPSGLDNKKACILERKKRLVTAPVIIHL
jgi:hypothetical protein